MTVTYRGHEITKNIDECGELIVYVETPSGPVDVASMRSARTMIDGMIEDAREFQRGY